MITMKHFSVFVPKKEDALLGYTGENLSRRFEIQVDDPGAWAYKLDVCNEAGAANIIDLTADGNTLYADLGRAALQVSGRVTAQIRAIDGDKVKCSNTFRLFIGDSVEAAAYFDSLDPTEFEQMEARVTEIRDEVEQMAADLRDVSADVEAAQTAARTAAEAAERAEAAATDVEAAVSDAAGAVREQVAADADRAAQAAENAGSAANTAAQDAAAQVEQNLGGYVTAAQNAAQEAETARTAAEAAQAAAEKAAEEAGAAAGGGVTSFNGRSGAVTPQKGDYSADDIAFEDGETFQQKFDSGTLHGQDGEDGHTPVKGTDYFTDADKAEMVQAVIDSGALSEAGHTHTAADVGARASTWVPSQTEVTVAASTDYSTVRVRGICIVADEAVSVPNGCLCGVYTSA